MNSKELAFIYNSIIAPWGVGFTVTATPLFYQGVTGGSELFVYSVDKLYIAKALEVGSTALSGAPVLSFHDELNAAMYNIQYTAILYDSTAAIPRYTGLHGLIKNSYFSRVSGGAISSIKFIGYRITRV